MSNIITSPNMGLPLPVPGNDPGPDYGFNNNVAFQTIDSHNHTAGKGVQIPPAGININADLSFNGNNATNLLTTRFNPQGSPIAATSPNLNCLYTVGVDLYYNDGNGNQIKITSAGAVNATSSGISSGTASASFISSVLVVNAASLTPANIQCASILLGNNVASSNYLTLSPPNSMASNYGLTLPPLPSSQKIMTLDNSGNITAPYTVDGTSISIISNVIQTTPARLTMPTVQRFLSGSGTYTLPANCLYIKVTLCGGGAGGQGLPDYGANGGTTTFGTSLLTATGGIAFNLVSFPGIYQSPGGTATVNSPAVALIAVSGGNAQGLFGANGAAGGSGGNNPFGGGAGGSVDNQFGINAAANTGGGGAGAGSQGGSSGFGGGAGGYIQAYIFSPSSTYSYAVGVGGTGGIAGGTANGSNGGSGIIIVEEFYNT